MPDFICFHNFPFHAVTTMCIRSSSLKNLLRSALFALRSALAALKRALSEVKRLPRALQMSLRMRKLGARSSARSEGSPSKPSTRVSYHRNLPTSPRVKYYPKHISHCII